MDFELNSVNSTDPTSKMERNRQSFDITERARTPSPAPTYRSVFHAHKDRLTPDFTSSTNPFYPYTSESSNSNPPNPNTHAWSSIDEKNDRSTHHIESEAEPNQSEPTNTFHPTPEPFDKNHPLYAPPSSPPPPHPYPQPNPSKRRTITLPPLRILLPWLLTLVFFLTTLWYTTIALGFKFLPHNPSQPATPIPDINIVINGINTPFVSIITTPTPTQTPATTVTARTTTGVGDTDAAPTPGRDPTVPMKASGSVPVPVPAPAPGSEEQRQGEAAQSLAGELQGLLTRVGTGAGARARAVETGAVRRNEGDLSRFVTVMVTTTTGSVEAEETGHLGGGGGGGSKGGARRRICGLRFRCDDFW